MFPSSGIPTCEPGSGTTTCPSATASSRSCGATRQHLRQSLGIRMAVASPPRVENSTIRIWDPVTGLELRVLTGHEGPVRSVTWRPDGKRLASGGSDKTIRIWDSTSGSLLLTLSGHPGAVTSVAWDPKNDRIASASKEGNIKLWDGKTMKEIFSWTNVGLTYYNPLAWSPDGKQLASGQGGLFRIWDPVSGLKVMSKAGGPGNSVTWSPDGLTLLTGSYSQVAQVQLWDAKTGQKLKSLSHPDGVESVTWSPDGRRFASGARSQSIALWDAASGERLATLFGHLGQVRTVAWSPDGTRLASGGEDRTVRIWNVVDRQKGSLDHNGARGIAWTPDGSRFVSLGGGVAKIWNTTTNQELLSFNAHGVVLAVSPDGRHLAAQSNQSTIAIWDLNQQKPGAHV